MGRLLRTLFLLFIIQSFCIIAYAQNAQVCATSGIDGPTNITGSINTYFPAQANTTLTAGANTINLLAVPATDAYGNNFGSIPIHAGDQLLIIQMQDAAISFSDDVLYGANNAASGTDGLGATGFTDMGNSGRYEYVVATNNVPLSGGTLTFKGSGTGNGTVYSYTDADPTTTRGKRLFQIIRIPQYSNLTLSSNISPPPFNGGAGGIIAFSVAGNMNFNGYTIDVSGRGFRGGYSLIKVTTSVNISDLYVAPSPDNRVSGKGEGIAGTPRYMWDGYNQVDNLIEGLPGGSGGRGAPANAGGGGNDVNSGGAGGGNGGDGGVGGLGYQVDPGTFPNGGRPGSTNFILTPDPARLIMGGGGGGGHANDALTGVKGGVGGGIVLINAITISGSGTISANGGDGEPGEYGGHPDGSGGGGAGGTVFIKLADPSPGASLTINVNGGKGGNTEFDDPATTGVQPHGPGGGGGGGQVFYAAPSVVLNTSITGGPSGMTNSGAGIAHGAGAGYNGLSTPFVIASLPPYLQGTSSICYPELVTTMRVPVAGVINHPGDVVTYIVKIINTATAGNAGGVEANCVLPTPITFQSATAAYSGNASGPTQLNNTGTSNSPVFGNFNISAGDSVVITLKAVISCTAASATYNSSAEATYLDPTRTDTQPNRVITAAINAFAGANTTYQDGPAGPVPGSNYDGTKATFEDVVVSNSPFTSNTITAPSTTSFCGSGSPGIITGSTPAGGSGIYAYQWQNSADNITFTDITNATAKDYTPSLLTATTYYRRIVSSGTCYAPLTSNVVEIMILPQPAVPVPVAANVAICAGSTATLSISNPQAGETYNWYDAATAGNLVAAGTQITTPTLSATTTYYAEGVNNSGGCTSTARAAVTVMVTQLPATPVPTAATVTICAGGTATLSISNTQAGITYNWYSSPAKTTLLYTGQSYTTDPLTANTTYYVDAVNSGPCSSPATASVQVNVDALPSAPVVSSNAASLCYGTSAVFTDSTPNIGYFNWYLVPTGGTPIATGETYITPPLTANITYYLESENYNGCVSTTRTEVTITIIPLPVSPQVPPVSVCQGSSALINIPSPQAGLTYNWYTTATAGTIINTGNSFTTPPITTATTYYIEAINATGCISTPRTMVQVNLTPLPSVPVVAGMSICTGNTATLSISSPQTGITYNWYDSAAKTNLLYTGTSYTTPALSANTTYYTEAENGSCASPSAASVVVNVSALPVEPAVNNSISNTCAGTQATLNIVNPQQGYTYNWYTAASGGTSVFTGATFVTPVLTASTTYYADATNGNGCTSATRSPLSIPVTLLPAAPQLSAGNVSICPGLTATLYAAASAGITINWYADATGGTALATGSNFTTPVLNSTTSYYAEAVNTNSCTSASRTMATVTVLGQLAAPIVTVGTTTATSVTFDWTAVPDATGYLVSTDNGLTYVAPTSGGDGLSETISGLETGTSVTILVEAIGASQCELSTSSTAVTAKAEYPSNNIVYVPNGFTPNGDGKNDIIYVHSESIKSMNFYVYDQWGELIFKSNSQQMGWDGTYKGNKEPVGVYVYYLHATMNNGELIDKKGTITLLR